MEHFVTVLPEKVHIQVADGANLLSVLRSAGLAPDAPCGGQGNCGKCNVLADGKTVLACRTAVDRDMTVALPQAQAQDILAHGIALPCSGGDRYTLAFDIGTTTVVGYLLQGSAELACESRGNPQIAFGADVISRIRCALSGEMAALTDSIRRCTEEITGAVCQKAGISPAKIHTVSMVGNPAMQQLFLGLPPENLAKIPFAPVLTEAKTIAAGAYLPLCKSAKLLVVPDISGFVGADTVACMLAAQLDTQEKSTLLVDIGTNGEMVLGNRHRRVACSTAAGPALEGANIQCGMRAAPGAIDHVTWDGKAFVCHVIGDAAAVGICGSGLIDAVAAALDAGLLNSRGRILNEAHILHLTDNVFLTQEDIRQVQAAKGAIAAGIQLMSAHLGLRLQDIDRVYLAGAFGTYMDPRSACRIGLLPPELENKIAAIGNAAGSGAKLLAADPHALAHAQHLADTTEHLNLAQIPNFPNTFAKQMML